MQSTGASCAGRGWPERRARRRWRTCAAAFAGAVRLGRVSAGLRCKRVRAHAQDATRPRMCAVGLIVQRSVGSPWRGGAGLPALGVWAEGLRHGRCYLEQKYQEVGVVLTLRGIGRGSGAAASASKSGGDEGRCSRTRGLRGSSGLPVATNQLTTALRKSHGEIGKSRIAGGEELRRRTNLPAARGLCSDSGGTGGAA